jgi:fructose-specific phosphotransferase system IIC component
MRGTMSEALTATSQSTLSGVAGALIFGLVIAWLVLWLTTHGDN